MNSSGPDLPPEARARLEEEVRSLREQRRQLAEDLSQRDPVGDRGDDSQALEGADELAWYDDRIAALERRLTGRDRRAGKGAEGLPPGSEVRVRFEDGTVQELRVVGIPEEVPEGEEDRTMTSDSPLALALAGSSAGADITYSTPDGPARVHLLDVRLPSWGG
ncbi:GreA/GreB family elongation factor [Saccharopolyspora erythraea]|uniref:GreA/GreB family elongation factor n=1 Tax=Saccharopolyspora erythraea TaxID=1836 RepID=UPI001BAA5BE1|nr:GreA/GreB family elongation factor [Saccharopolyspora erythraea]QUH02351.1 GreA/GreB family elongation factor [Saccharopolyspora erythraea]